MNSLAVSVAAVVVTFALFVPYIVSIRRGETKPHVFSWLIWGMGTLIVSFAQLAGGGGLGAVVITLSGLVSCYVALLAYLHRSDASITRTDWVFFVVALSALPAWFITDNPLWTVVILTTADLVGFGPTFRAAYARPHDERMWFYSLAALRNALVILALGHHSLTTVLFPAAVGAACAILALFLAWRRRFVATDGGGTKLEPT